MRIYLLILLSFIFLYKGTASSDSKTVLTEEEMEIIKVLDMLRDYDFLKQMELYDNMDSQEEEEPLNTKSPVRDKVKR